MEVAPAPGSLPAMSTGSSISASHSPLLDDAGNSAGAAQGGSPRRPSGSTASTRCGPAPSDTPAQPLLSLLVCYDIVDDDIRTGVANRLSRLGPRVQLSTFECRVSDRAELAKLAAELREMMDPACDQIRIYNLGRRRSAPMILGRRQLEEWDDFLII